MTTFYLIRHGEPDWELKAAKQLSPALRDFVPLTETGIAQAEQAAEAYDYSTCDVIISSPYTRSLQTAAIINRSYGLPLKVEYDLHEWTPDNWTADTVEELTLLWRDFMDNDGIHPANSSRLWETKESVYTRVVKVLNKYLSYKEVAVVCHGMVIAILMNLSSESVPHCGRYEFTLTESETLYT